MLTKTESAGAISFYNSSAALFGSSLMNMELDLYSADFQLCHGFGLDFVNSA